MRSASTAVSGRSRCSTSLAGWSRRPRLPVIVQPNAGLPVLDRDGRTVFPGTPTEMGAFAAAARQAGVAGIGSCCGSTPIFTGAIVDAVADKDVVEVPDRGYRDTVLAGPRRIVTLGRRIAGASRR